MTPTQSVPTIPRWIVRATTGADGLPDGFLAVRIDELSTYQQIYGCRTEVTASTAAELETLCVAEIVHAAMVAQAEERMHTARRIAAVAADKE